MKQGMDDIRTRTLIEKFFNGTTGIEEEQALYEYFTSDNVSSEFVKYKEMFTGFAAIAIPDKSITGSKGVDAGQNRLSVFTKYRKIIIATAAAATLVFGLFIAKDIRYEQKLARTYGGSYMIVNGERIDDLREIKNEIEETLYAASVIEMNADINATVKDAEQNVLDNIKDAKERERIYKLLNE